MHRSVGLFFCFTDPEPGNAAGHSIIIFNRAQKVIFCAKTRWAKRKNIQPGKICFYDGDYRCIGKNAIR